MAKIKCQNPECDVIVSCKCQLPDNKHCKSCFAKLNQKQNENNNVANKVKIDEGVMFGRYEINLN